MKISETKYWAIFYLLMGILFVQAFIDNTDVSALTTIILLIGFWLGIKAASIGLMNVCEPQRSKNSVKDVKV